jgi:ATP-dependent helicase HrpB
MIALPIDGYLDEITAVLRRAKSAVIVAEPGAGKTTRVPPGILRSGILSGDQPNIVILQPRRVAARAAAARIADENAWTVGCEVGYQIRFERKIGPETRLRVLTEGVLTRQMLDDPFLDGVGVVILDEFHERSLHLDLAIAMLREMQQTVRPDLHIVVMSATMDAAPAAKFLGDCLVIEVPGRMFGVEIEYEPGESVSVVDRVAEAVRDVVAKEESQGDVLVFLPGAQEIRAVQGELSDIQQRLGWAVLPLYGSLAAEEQMAALRPLKQRKIILATNIAETSLTIDGVKWVIDSGLARVPMFDVRRGVDHLELKRISKASAAQRAGRAGRTAAGKCVRLWSMKEQAALEEFELPEVRRVDLCGAVLDLYAWGKSDAAAFGWFEAPAREALEYARNLLEMLGAVDRNGVTELGRRLMRVPLHPRIGRMLCAAADLGCLEEGAILAAILSEEVRLPRERRATAVVGDSDLLLMVDDFGRRSEYREGGQDVRRVSAELLRIGKRLGRVSRRPPDRETLLKLPLLAYPDRVCRRRGSDPSAGVMVGGGGVRLDRESVVRDSEFFVALDARGDPRLANREAAVRIASAIQPHWLMAMFPQSIVHEQIAQFDEQRQRVVGRRIVRYRDLVLSEEMDAAVDPDQAGKILAEALLPRAAEFFDSDETAGNFLNRVALLRRAMSEQPWPKYDVEELREILRELCVRKKSVEEVRRQPLAAALEARLQYPLDQLLRREAPEAIEVPSGSKIGLEYRGEQAPILAVRLQEVFSWHDTPRIAGGRVAVLLHLLGPNFRPVQVTDDLRSFWKTTYFQVRKDLRVRYPKHSWPENPLTAKPEAKGRARRKPE